MKDLIVLINVSFLSFINLKKFETGNIFTGQMLRQRINEIGEDEIESLSKDLKINKEMNHPSILKLIGYSPIDFKKTEKQWLLVNMHQMDLCLMFYKLKE